MHVDLPPEIQVTVSDEDVRYVFPARNAGPLRLLGLPFALMGGFFLIFSTVFLTLFLGIAAFGDQQPEAGSLLCIFAFVLAGLAPFYLVGIALFGFGMHIVVGGNGVLELKGGIVTARDGWWILKWSRRRYAAELSGVSVAPPEGIRRRHLRNSHDEIVPVADAFETPPRRSLFGTLWTAAAERSQNSALLRLESASKKPLDCLLGYPPAWLVPVGEDFARRCGIPFRDQSGGPSAVVEADRVTSGPDSERGLAPASNQIDISTIETSPVSWSSSNFRDKELVSLGPDQLILTNSTAGRIFYGGFLCVGLLILALTSALIFHVEDGKDWWKPLSIGLFATVFLGVGLYGLVGAAPAAFDKGQDEFTTGPRWSRLRRPLSEIQAVQILPGNRSHGKTTYQPFEMNLVFADRSRRNLSNNSDLAWTRSAAARLAEFLAVPLVDQS